MDLDSLDDDNSEERMLRKERNKLLLSNPSLWKLKKTLEIDFNKKVR